MKSVPMLTAGILVGWLVMSTPCAADPSAYDHLKKLECFLGNWEATMQTPSSSANSERVKKWEGKPISLQMKVTWASGKGAQSSQ